MVVVTGMVVVVTGMTSMVVVNGTVPAFAVACCGGGLDRTVACSRSLSLPMMSGLGMALAPNAA